MRKATFIVMRLLITTSVGAQQIYWKRDHVYRGPGGKEIAIVTPPPADQTAPTAPSNLTNQPPTQTQVQLNWNGSTDSGGSGLAGYKIYRGGVPVETVPAGTLTFTDKPLRPNTTYSYHIRSFDNAQNHSATSNSINVIAVASSTGTTLPDPPPNFTG